MAKRQTRKSISVRAATYHRVRDYAESHNVSMSDFVEQRIAEFFGERYTPNPITSRPPRLAQLKAAQARRAAPPSKPAPVVEAVVVVPAARAIEIEKPKRAPVPGAPPKRQPQRAQNFVINPAKHAVQPALRTHSISTGADDPEKSGRAAARAMPAPRILPDPWSRS